MVFIEIYIIYIYDMMMVVKKIGIVGTQSC